VVLVSVVLVSVVAQQPYDGSMTSVVPVPEFVKVAPVRFVDVHPVEGEGENATFTFPFPGALVGSPTENSPEVNLVTTFSWVALEVGFSLTLPVDVAPVFQWIVMVPVGTDSMVVSFVSPTLSKSLQSEGSWVLITEPLKVPLVTPPPLQPLMVPDDVMVWFFSSVPTSFSASFAV
jgi:hypothetical protein